MRTLGVVVISFLCGSWTVACDSGPTPVVTEVDAGPPAPAEQGSPAQAALVINEVAPRPGIGPDWIELVNRSDQAIDLCGYFVTDDLDRLDHYLPLGGASPPAPCTAILLAPGEYHVILADDDPAAGPDRAPFGLGDDDQVHVVTLDGLPIDSLIYLYPRGESRATLARLPDGEGLFHLTRPTQGSANLEEVAP